MYFINAQKGKTDWYRYALIIIIIFLASIFLAGMSLLIPVPEGMPNLSLLVMLLPSALCFFILWFAMVYGFGVNWKDIASAYGRFRWRNMLTAALLWLTLTLLAELILNWGNAEAYTFNFDAARFIPLVLVALLFIPFQAGFEELLFRSLLLTGMGLLFRSRFVALLITAALFGALHMANPEVQKYGFWETMPYYMGFGVFAALVVIFDNGIEMVLGIHAINNIYSAVLVNYEDSVIPTHSLLTVKELQPVEMVVSFFIMAAVFILIMAKVNAWRDWRKLFQKIPPAVQTQKNIQI